MATYRRRIDSGYIWKAEEMHIIILWELDGYI